MVERLFRALARWAVAGAIALALAVSPAFATSTTSVALTNAAYTDLGAGPITLGSYGGSVVFQIADSQPAANSAGFVEQHGAPPVGINTTSHIWAISGGGSVYAIVTSGVAFEVSSGTFSATISGFAPASSYSTLSVSTTSSRVALPVGSPNIVVYNTGTSAAEVQLGNASVVATTSNDVIQPNSWMSFTVGSNVYLAAITASGTASLNISGGTGLPTGAGGGGGGSGGAVTESGTWTVQPGNTANTTAWLVTGTGGVFPASESGTWNITNISGTVSLPTGAATSANQPTNSAIGGTTSGQTGNLHMGAVTSAAPSYTTGQTDPLSLNLSGGLRVDGSGVTQPVSAASLPLPSGAATSANQSTEITSLGTIATNSGTEATAANQTTGNTSLSTIATNSGTQATAANQTTIITDITRPQGVIAAATAPSYMSLGGGVYNSGGVSLSNGQSAALQFNSAGALLVSGAAGGTSLADEGAFTQGTTAATPLSALYATSITNLTAGQAGAVRSTNDRKLMVDTPNIEAALTAATAPTYGVGILGQYNSTAPTLTSAQTAALQLTSAGSLHTWVDNTLAALMAADAISTSTLASMSPVGSLGLLWNGTTYDRQKEAGVTGAAMVGGMGAVGSTFAGNPLVGGALGSGATGGEINGLIQADTSTPINVSTATTTQLVALSSGRKIYVTSYDVVAGGTGNITFEYGTGSNCATGTTALTGAYNLTAQNGIAKGNGEGPVLVVPAGNALCVLTSAAVQMSGSVATAQF